MSRKFYLGLFLAGLLVAIFTASLQQVPGYMDAEYYYAGALRIAEGWGLQEPYLWNYLNDPQGLPVPAFAYWMPLPSLLAAVGLLVVPGLGFWAARIGFIVLAALVPPLTARIGAGLTGKPAHARLAGLLALFPGFYLAYQTTTDAFPIYMVLGGLFILVAFDRDLRFAPGQSIYLRLFGVGLIAGLMHLTRADGILWFAGGLAVTLFWFWYRVKAQVRPVRWTHLLSFVSVVAFGYALVMLPWYGRNISVWGSFFPSGNSRALWLTVYEETMIYPASLLTPQRWMAAGFLTHLTAWGEALSSNLQTAFAIQGGIVLLPFILAAMRQLRACPQVWFGAGMWLLTAVMMTLVFPFAGTNGSFFHAGAALQPLLWALTPLGVESLMTAYARWRRFETPQRIIRFISVLLVVFGLLLSSVLFYQRVVGSDLAAWAWHAGDQHYREVELTLAAFGATPCEAVLVNNPPGYWLASRRAAGVIPYGDESTLLEVARRFDIHYVILELTNPDALVQLYEQPESSADLEYLTSVGTTRLFRVVEPPRSEE